MGDDHVDIDIDELYSAYFGYTSPTAKYFQMLNIMSWVQRPRRRNLAENVGSARGDCSLSSI